jgi:hypothetical protein
MCFVYASSLRRRLDPLGIGVPLSSDDCVWIKVMAICGPLGTSICVLGCVGCLVIGTQPSSCIWDGVLCAVCRLLTFFSLLDLLFVNDHLVFTAHHCGVVSTLQLS